MIVCLVDGLVLFVLFLVFCWVCLIFLGSLLLMILFFILVLDGVGLVMMNIFKLLFEVGFVLLIIIILLLMLRFFFRVVVFNYIWLKYLKVIFYLLKIFVRGVLLVL